MNKIISFLILVVVSYLVSVFFVPNISSKIDSLIGMNGLTEKIISIKGDANKNSTSDLSDIYSGAIEKIDETKSKIDDIRSTAKQVEDTYNKASDFVDETGKKIDEAKKTLDDIGSVGESIKNVVNTNNVK